MTEPKFVRRVTVRGNLIDGAVEVSIGCAEVAVNFASWLAEQGYIVEVEEVVEHHLAPRSPYQDQVASVLCREFVASGG